MNVLILGANGFIGNSLVRAILERTDWRVSGIDRDDDRLEHSLGHPRFEFLRGDVTTDRESVDTRIARSDVVLPLVAIARPQAYVRRPLDVFALTFEENLRVARLCARASVRLVFPSSSEVYGKNPASRFDEDESDLVLGPVDKERWIYASAKQLLERVIWALGRHEGLNFTMLRPFNWIGPRLDDGCVARQGGSRVVSQFVDDLVAGRPLKLVDGGRQRRCFTHIDDGVDCLIRILHDPQRCARGQIFNVGNPANDCSLRDLAHKLRALFAEHPAGRERVTLSEIVAVPAREHYGPGYEDVAVRVPSIAKAEALLGWRPRVGLDEALRRTLSGRLERSLVAVGR